MFENEPAMQEIVQTLIDKDPVFSRIFVDITPLQNLTPDEETRANDCVKELYPNLNLREFAALWVVNRETNEYTVPEEDPVQASSICPGAMFDPTNGAYARTTIVPPPKRRKKEEFDVYKFILQKDDNEERFQINLEDPTDEDDPDPYDLSYEDRLKLETSADQALRKMARIVTVLNTACAYRILDLHSETKIH